MRLESEFISNYKNLKNFTLGFDGASFSDVFVGKNGSGKSNLFEALVEIFRHIYEYDNEKAKLNFEYAIKYEIDGKETEVIWKAGKFSINGKTRATIGKTPLPDNVLIYYSGHNDTVARLVEKTKRILASASRRPTLTRVAALSGSAQNTRHCCWQFCSCKKPPQPFHRND